LFLEGCKTSIFVRGLKYTSVGVSVQIGLVVDKTFAINCYIQCFFAIDCASGRLTGRIFVQESCPITLGSRSHPRRVAKGLLVSDSNCRILWFQGEFPCDSFKRELGK